MITAHFNRRCWNQSRLLDFLYLSPGASSKSMFYLTLLYLISTRQRTDRHFRSSWRRPLLLKCFPCGSDGKENAFNAGDTGGWIPRLGRFPRGGNSNPLQCSCLEDYRDDGGLYIVRGIAKSLTQLRNHHFFTFPSDIGRTLRREPKA